MKNKDNTSLEKHRMYCAKSGRMCLVNHMGNPCPDVIDCEGCNGKETKPITRTQVEKLFRANSVTSPVSPTASQGAQDWEKKTKKEVERILLDLVHKWPQDGYTVEAGWYQIKDVVSQLLQKQKKELVEKIIKELVIIRGVELEGAKDLMKTRVGYNINLLIEDLSQLLEGDDQK